MNLTFSGPHIYETLLSVSNVFVVYVVCFFFVVVARTLPRRGAGVQSLSPLNSYSYIVRPKYVPGPCVLHVASPRFNSRP